jgi:uncharacterized protein (TIGR02145 family)
MGNLMKTSLFACFQKTALIITLLCGPYYCYSQTHVFVGNGNWTNPSNWLGGVEPPDTIPVTARVVIAPALWDSCVLNKTQTFAYGARLILNDGCRFIINGNLLYSPPDTVAICNQVWMKRNLDVDTYNNGDPIPKVTDANAWINMTSGAYCYYQNDSASYASLYGKLYNWYAVTDPRGIAPPGWHIPTTQEWDALSTCLGGNTVSGGAIKEAGINHWLFPNTGATNSSGFTALPGNYRDPSGYFSVEGIYAFFWSANEYNSTDAFGRRARYDNTTFYLTSGVKYGGHSIRCIKD